MDNPPENRLPAGITNDMVAKAITSSGYPLQSRVAAVLSEVLSGNVHEEWSYFDKDTNGLRALDLVATKPLGKRRRGLQQSRVRANLAILTECKQSDLPYVFFQSRGAHSLYDIPAIGGLRHRKVRITTKDTGDTYSYSIQTGLGLGGLPFVSDPAPKCTTLSRIVRKGSTLELSGSEGYNNVVLPLLKALLHYERINTPKDTFAYFDAILVLPVAVLDAPMILANVGEEDHSASFIPWIRLMRGEAQPDAKVFDTHRIFGIDFVHWNYLRTYLTSHVLPFAEEFALRVSRHQHALVDGKGYISDPDVLRGNNIESALRRSRRRGKGPDD